MQAGNFKLLSKVKEIQTNYADCFQGNNSYSGRGGGMLLLGEMLFAQSYGNLAMPVVVGNKMLS
jgi:hypothetical protein